VFDLISVDAHDRLQLSDREWVDGRALLVDERGVPSSVWGGVKWESMKDRRKRLAFSRGAASFSNMYDLLVVCLLERVGSGPTRAM
jgi:hypothetical protein